MTTQSLQHPSWEAYDLRKSQVKEDPSIFCPEQLWEFNYLLENIVGTEPHLDPIMVMLAIRQATRETMAPRPRNYFVQVVMDSIREREHQWSQILNNSQQDAA
ncbi:MAG: hypothetical protein J7497_17235 [Chitinophagaceae bacterium]|nr:hypothetical protein [Chitinophagaceae bacterium]